MTLLRSAANILHRAATRFRASLYEGASQTRRTLGWRTPTSSANAALWSLGTARDRSRAAARNNGYAKGIFDKLVSNIIGTGITFRSLCPDEGFRKAIQPLWDRWTLECDADGLLDWNGLQSLGVRAWLEGGEVFTRRRDRLPGDGLVVPMQLQLLEPELCPHTHHVLTGPNRVRAGIEFDAIGRRVAYWFHPSRPDDPNDFDRAQLRRVPADSVAPLYDILRPGQIRGLPLLITALVRLHELDKIDDAVVLRQHLSNLFVAFIKRSAGSGDDPGIHPLTGGPESENGEPTALRFEPGIMQELDLGQEVEFSKPPDPSANYPDFMRQQLRAACASAKVPYEIVTGDMRDLNDRTMRVLLHEFRRQISAWQHQQVVHMFCRPVWQWWLVRAFLSRPELSPWLSAFLENPEPFLRGSWVPQGWPYLHPVQDVQAQKAAVRAGFTSRGAVVSEQGEDAAAIDAEQEADNKRAEKHGLSYDSDGRRPEKGVGAKDSSTSREKQLAGATT